MGGRRALKFRPPSAEQFTHEIFLVPQTWKWYWMMLSVYQYMFQGRISKNHIFNFKGKWVGEEPMDFEISPALCRAIHPWIFFCLTDLKMILGDAECVPVHVPRSSFQKSHFDFLRVGEEPMDFEILPALCRAIHPWIFFCPTDMKMILGDAECVPVHVPWSFFQNSFFQISGEKGGLKVHATKIHQLATA